jgi:hypothetical protein
LLALRNDAKFYQDGKIASVAGPGRPSICRRPTLIFQI